MRSPVNKSKSHRSYKQRIARTERLNMPRSLRGGIRL